MTTAVPLSDIAAEPSALFFLGVAVAAAVTQGSLLRRGLRLQQRVHEWRAAAASGQWRVLDPLLVPGSGPELVALALLAALPLALLALALRARALFPHVLVTVDVIERARWVARTVAAPLHAVRVGLVLSAAVWLAAGAIAYCDAVLVASEGTPHVPWAVRAHDAEAALDAARSRFNATAQRAPWAQRVSRCSFVGAWRGETQPRGERARHSKRRGADRCEGLAPHGPDVANGLLNDVGFAFT